VSVPRSKAPWFNLFGHVLLSITTYSYWILTTRYTVIRRVEHPTFFLQRTDASIIKRPSLEVTVGLYTVQLYRYTDTTSNTPELESAPLFTTNGQGDDLPSWRLENWRLNITYRQYNIKRPNTIVHCNCSPQPKSYNAGCRSSSSSLLSLLS
jgi:hypothetical protein